MEASVLALFKNTCFWSAFCAWGLAQLTKMLIGFYRTRRLDFLYMVSTGGMPSAHSAMVCGLMTAVGLNSGFGSPVFALALAFAMITMFDAATVRRASGLQARLLNEIVKELFKEHHLSEQKLAELLGHTRPEVFMGMVMGILVGLGVDAMAVLYWL